MMNELCSTLYLGKVVTNKNYSSKGTKNVESVFSSGSFTLFLWSRHLRFKCHTQNYNFTCYFVWMWNLVSHPNQRMYTETENWELSRKLGPKQESTRTKQACNKSYKNNRRHSSRLHTPEMSPEIFPVPLWKKWFKQFFEQRPQEHWTHTKIFCNISPDYILPPFYTIPVQPERERNWC